MYKLLNKLFGWDYIYWNNSVDFGIAKIYRTFNGITYYYRYRNIIIIDRITDPNKVLWLTCDPKKYGFN